MIGASVRDAITLSSGARVSVSAAAAGWALHEHWHGSSSDILSFAKRKSIPQDKDRTHHAPRDDHGNEACLEKKMPYGWKED